MVINYFSIKNKKTKKRILQGGQMLQNFEKDFKIIIIEDDSVLLTGLAEALKIDGIKIITASTVKEGMIFFQGDNYSQPADIVVLDLNLPDGSGFDILKIIKKNYPAMPVLILSARSSEIDKVLGLEFGADDYVCKPFSLRELQARIKAIIRRSNLNSSISEKNDIFKFEKLHVNFFSREVFINNAPIKLSFTEFQILKILINNPNMVIERELLLEKIWNGVYIDFRSIDPHISRLRKKIAPYGTLIETIPNVGYKFKI